MTRPVNTKFNRRRVENKAPTRRYVCMTCRRTREWSQVGDLPDRCLQCSKVHNAETNNGKDTNRPWALDDAVGETINDRLDKILHWSPEISRWLYWDGDRWVRGTDVDACAIVKSLMFSTGAIENTVEHNMEAFRLFIVERLNGNPGRH